MHSLFFKIFVWFWLAMALVVAASTVSSMMAFSEGPKHLGGQLAMYGLAATDKLAREGKGGADNYLNLLERTTRTRAYLFDENANGVAGKVSASNAPGGGLSVEILLPITTSEAAQVS